MRIFCKIPLGRREIVGIFISSGAHIKEYKQVGKQHLCVYHSTQPDINSANPLLNNIPNNISL